jgi:integrase
MPRRIKKSLTKLACERAKPRMVGRGSKRVAKSVKLLDADTKGLMLNVSASGAKSWVWRYQLNHQVRWLGLGGYPAIGLARARELAREHAAVLAQKQDPKVERDRKRAEYARELRERVPFKNAAEAFISVHSATWRNDKHRQQWRTTLRLYAHPSLGDLAVKDIQQADITACIAELQKRAPETAKRTKQRIERVIEWEKAGRPEPINGNGKRAHHKALSWSHIPQFMADVRSHRGMAARALEFCILAASRTSEVLNARWAEIDFDAKVWTVPAERMKAGKEHRVPLSSRAVEILQNLPREGAYVFPGAKGGQPMSNMAMLVLVRRLRPGEKLTTHGFRSSFRDWAGDCSHAPVDIIEFSLAHVVKSKTEAAYRRGDALEKRRVLMQEWADFCVKPPTEVINIADKVKRNEAATR